MPRARCHAWPVAFWSLGAASAPASSAGAGASAAGRHVQVERRPGAGRRRRARSQRAIRPGLDRARFRGARRRPDARRSPISGTIWPASASRCCSTSAAAWKAQLPNAREAATHVLSWLDATRDEAAVFTFDTQPRRGHAVHDGSADAARRRCRRSMPFGATSLHDAIAETARRVGDARRAAARGRRAHRRQRQREPADAGAKSRRIASAIDVPVYIFGIVPSIDNPAAETSTTVGASVGARRPAGRSRGLDRRPRVRGEHAGDSAASRRGRSSTSCGISISSRSNRAASRAGIRSWSARATRT